jgi:hypothetical protein
VLVRGDRDSYEIHTGSGAIFRSDGRRVRVTSNGTPPTALPIPGIGSVLGILLDAIALAQDDRHATCMTEQG